MTLDEWVLCLGRDPQRGLGCKMQGPACAGWHGEDAINKKRDTLWRATGVPRRWLIKVLTGVRRDGWQEKNSEARIWVRLLSASSSLARDSRVHSRLPVRLLENAPAPMRFPCRLLFVTATTPPTCMDSRPRPRPRRPPPPLAHGCPSGHTHHRHDDVCRDGNTANHRANLPLTRYRSKRVPTRARFAQWDYAPHPHASQVVHRGPGIRCHKPPQSHNLRPIDANTPQPAGHIPLGNAIHVVVCSSTSLPPPVASCSLTPPAIGPRHYQNPSA